MAINRLLLGFVILALITLFSSADDSIVVTKIGAVRGNVNQGSRSFKGIPFIEPPLGNLRFAPPVPKTPWSGTLDATQYKPGCPQECILPPHTCPPVTSEDCIQLNIFTPSVQNLGVPQPVMVWLPGGHFDQGSAGTSLYDSEYFVNRTNVIVVTVNYRLGILGWLASNKVPGLTGNLGLFDQRMALMWVRDNIAAFGGDPTQITLFGQSAGATSTAAHLVSQGSKGLFQKAIIQSDPITLQMRTLASATDSADCVLKNVSCSTLECLRGKSLDQLLNGQYACVKKMFLAHPLIRFLPWVPTIDGNDITMEFMDAAATGDFHHMPIIIGSVSEEALLFIYMALAKPVNGIEYDAGMALIFGRDALEVLGRYPTSSGAPHDKRALLSRMGTDYIFTAPIRAISRDLAANMPEFPVHVYQFNHSWSFEGWGPRYPFCNGHVCHAAELPYLFYVDGQSGIQFTENEKVMANSMIDYWSNFARSGNPNMPRKVNGNAPLWPTFDAMSLLSLEIMTPACRIIKGLEKNICDFWDTIGYTKGT